MKILIVDDEQLIRQGLRMIIEGSGFSADQILEAGSGREAVRLAGEARPEIILMDIKMPGMDGLSALREIRKVLPDTQAIILTAYGLFEYAQEAVRCGARDYLLKPVEPADLIKVLEECKARIDSIMLHREKETLLEEDLLHTKSTIETELVWDLISGIEVSRQRLLGRLGLIRPHGARWFGDGVFPETCLVLGDVNSPELSGDCFKAAYCLIKERLAPALAAGVEGRLVVLTAFRFDLEKIRLLKGDILAKTGCLLAAGIGGPVSAVNRISEAYINALEALGCAYGHGREVVWSPRSCHREHGKEIFRALLAGGGKQLGMAKKKIINQLNSDRDKMSGDRLFDILSTVYLTVKDAGADRWAAGSFFCRYAGQLPGLPSSSEVESWLDRMIEEAFSLVKNPSQDRTQQIVNLAVNFIRHNYQKPITLKDVAHALYLSPTYFSAVFKQQTGVSFTKYLNNIRVEKAKALLSGTGRSVSEIARAVGYLEGNYFCRVFKKVTGTTPGEYRRS